MRRNGRGEGDCGWQVTLETAQPVLGRLLTDEFGVTKPEEQTFVQLSGDLADGRRSVG